MLVGSKAVGVHMLDLCLIQFHDEWTGRSSTCPVAMEYNDLVVHNMVGKPYACRQQSCGCPHVGLVLDPIPWRMDRPIIHLSSRHGTKRCSCPQHGRQT